MWFVPRFDPAATEAMDVVDLMYDFRAAAQFMDGYLGEHNWAANAVTDRDDCAADYALRTSTTFTAVDWSTADARGEPTASPANSYKVPGTANWHLIEGMEKVVDTRGGKLWVIASLQFSAGPDSTLGAASSYWTIRGGLRFAIFINGSLVPETAPGGYERQGERNDASEGPVQDVGARMLNTVLTIPPGRVTISIRAKRTRPDDNNPLTSDVFYEVFNRELILVEGH